MTNIYPSTFQKRIDDIYIGSCSLKELATTYGTPLYVLDEQTIRNNCRVFTHILDEHYPNFTIAYASKAGLNLGIANIIASENCGVDVVSGGELHTALNSNISTDRIYFHGNNKSIQELTLAIEHDIRIVIDNQFELSNIEQIASQLNKQALIMFRIKPGIEAHTHEYIKTGHIDSKFGLTFEETMPLIETVHNSTWGTFTGVHAHIGSQIFEIQPYFDLVAILLDFIKQIKTTYDINTPELNYGGGFGIQYVDTDQAPDISSIILNMANETKLLCDSHSLILPKLIFEPGRSIIANSGVTIYSAGATKVIPNVKNYLFVDGGMADNPRPITYKAKHTFDVISPKSPDFKLYTIAGKFCESGDILAENIKLPTVSPNDHIVVYGTGAYNYSMASNYNRSCKPAMVLVNNGQHREIVRRESYNDIMRFDEL